MLAGFPPRPVLRSRRLTPPAAAIVAFGIGLAGATSAEAAWDRHYFEGSPRVEPVFTLANGWTSQDRYPRLVGDIDGDGDDDIVGFGYREKFIRFATASRPYSTGVRAGSGFTHVSGWRSQNTYPRVLVDIDGDGSDDILGFGASKTYWQLSTGTGFGSTRSFVGFSVAQGWSSQDAAPRFAGDIDGDGDADIVGIRNGEIWISVGTSSGFGAPYRARSGFGGWYSQDTYPRALVDVTNDGRADLVGFGASHVFAVPARTTGIGFGSSIRVGTGFTHADGWVSQAAYPRRFADVDGDGWMDIVGYGSSQVYVGRRVPGPTIAFENYAAHFGSHTYQRGWDSDARPRLAGDANDDGTGDMIGFDPRGIVYVPSRRRPTPANPIVTENARPGTRSWEPGCASSSCFGSDTSGEVEAYFSRTSVNRGSAIGLKISTSQTRQVTVDLYRIGYYQGDGARLVRTIGPFSSSPQLPCQIDSATGRVECGWNVTHVLWTDPAWTTGIYLAKITRSDGYIGYAQFCLRNDSRAADFRYQQPVTTYAAYNRFPRGGIGKSFYRPKGAVATEVSFDRPYEETGDGYLFTWEHDLIMWLESEGYDVTYTTNVDLEEAPASLVAHTGFISAGHDEYWSDRMYDGVMAARRAGVDLAFFGANASYWRVQWSASSAGPNRRIRKLNKFRDTSRPEQKLMGVHYVKCCDGNNTPWIVDRRHLRGFNHSGWLFAGSGLRDGDRIRNLVGYEIDQQTYIPTTLDPSISDFTILSSSPYGGHTSNSVIFRDVSGAYVFASGTMSWSWGLMPSRRVFGFRYQNDHDLRQVHRGLQVTTRNLLDRFRFTPRP